MTTLNSPAAASHAPTPGKTSDAVPGKLVAVPPFAAVAIIRSIEVARQAFNAERVHYSTACAAERAVTF